jgi:hypothetical protein
VNRLDAAIMRTILYADVFDFAMTPAEIHHYLIHDQPVTREQVAAALTASPDLRQHLTQRDGYVAQTDHASLIALRQEREALAAAQWARAVAWSRWLARLPFVRMVALTGALAMRNPSAPDDDIDYLVVTGEGRVWLARGLAILIVRVGRLRGVTLCPNYVLAENALAQSRRDLYIAHEVAQAHPFYGHEIYAALRDANRWLTVYLPNAGHPLHAPDGHAPRDGWMRLKRAAEWALGGWLGDRLERWERGRKMRRFQKAIRPDSAAKLDPSQVKGHFEDHGARILRHYRERLQRFGLLDSAAAD